MGGRGRAGRDVPAVGADRGAHRARVGRAAGRAPGQAQLQRAALGRQARRGDGAGEGDPVRPADRRRRGQVNYARVDPAAARELFITTRWSRATGRPTTSSSTTTSSCWTRRQELEDQARRRGIVADDAALFDFYDRRIPEDVTSARHFDSWWKKTRADARPADVHARRPDRPGRRARSDAGRLSRPLGRAPADVRVRARRAGRRRDRRRPAGHAQPGQRRRARLAGAGPREELVTELIRSLPKDLRRLFVPAPDTARAVPARLGEPHGDLLDALGRGARPAGRRAGAAGRVRSVPAAAHLRMTFRVMDGDQELAAGKDLGALREQLRPRLQATLTEAASDLTRTGLRTGTIGTLPRVFTRGQVTAYPALADAGRRGGRPAVPRPRPRPARPCGGAPAGCSCSRCRPVRARSPTGCRHSGSWR